MNGKTLAVVGVSADPAKYGHKIFRDLVAAGYLVSGVNPKGGKILGQKIFMSLIDLPLIPDIVITVVPPVVTEAIVDQCHELGIHEIWMQPGSESEAAIAKAKKYGITVTANACFMTVNHLW